MTRSTAVAIAVAGLATSCGGDDADDTPDTVTVEGAWARATPAAASVGVVYLTVSSPVDDALVGASVDPAVAGEVQLHRTEVADDGTATMVERPSLPVPAGGELVLDPLGDHLMLVDLVAPLTLGETFDVSLQFEGADDVIVEVEVRDDEP